MKKILKIIFLYLIIFISLFVCHRFSPTNLAGPGLDFFIYILSFVLVLALLGLSIYKSFKNRMLDYLVIVHMPFAFCYLLY